MSSTAALVPGSVTSILAEHISSITYESLPDEVRLRAVELIADTLGSIVAGQELDSTQALQKGLDAAGTLIGDMKIPGWDVSVNPIATAMLAGASAHGFDFDDTHAPAQIHPGAPILSAALAAVQTSKADGSLPTAADFVAGVVAGYEAMTRVSYGLNPDNHARRGFHLSSTTGVFGAAAAVSVILGYSQQTLEHAWGTALSMAAGSGQFMLNGAWTKRVHVGNAAANGYLSAQLAATGVTGAADSLSGRDGFYNLYSTDPTPELAIADLNSWEILRTGIKPYPCCRAIHASLEAVLELQDEHKFVAEDVASLRVGLPERCHQVTCDPAEAKRNPQNIVDCQFSLHLCLAQAITTGRFVFSDYEASLKDENVKDLMRRIVAYVDAEADSIYPESFPSRVEIKLSNGRVLDSWIKVSLGEPQRMPSKEQAQEKFVGLTTSAMGQQLAVSLFNDVYALLDSTGDEALARILRGSEERSELLNQI